MKKRPKVIAKERDRATRDTRRRTEAMEILSRFEIADILDNIPGPARHSILATRCSLPVITFDESITNTDMIHKVKDLFQSFLETMRMRFAQDDNKEKVALMTPAEYYGVILGIYRGMRTCPIADKRTAIAVNDASMEVYDFCKGINGEVSNETYNTLKIMRVFATRINDGYCRIEPVQEPDLIDNIPLTFKVFLDRPESRYFKSVRGHREAFRAGNPLCYEKPVWLSIDAGLVGGKLGESMPIYIQNHCSKRLLERIAKAGITAEFFLGALSDQSHHYHATGRTLPD